jgi:hypothetical protein
MEPYAFLERGGEGQHGERSDFMDVSSVLEGEVFRYGNEVMKRLPNANRLHRVRVSYHSARKSGLEPSQTGK